MASPAQVLTDFGAKLVEYAPAILALFKAFDSPQEAVTELRRYELAKRRANDGRIGRLP